jgi:predicted N-acetyltransferase YhbS
MESAAGRFRKNMPNPIPVAVLARVAVDRDWQGQRIGRAMFRDPARRVAQAADAINDRHIGSGKPHRHLFDSIGDTF